MPVEYKDYYKLLGVERSASQEEIQKAFHKLARKYHPDVSKEPDAEARFKEVNEAYEVLKDPENRRKYDSLGAQWKSGQSFTPPPGWEAFDFHSDSGDDGLGGFSEFFKSIFGQGFGGFGGDDSGARRSRGRGKARQWAQRGEDHVVDIELTLEEAFRGGTKTIELVDRVPQPDGRVSAKRRNYDVTIPRGVVNGSKVRLAGQGGPGIGGGRPGDLFLRVRLRPDSRFEAHAHDLRTTISIAPWEAALGADVPLELIEGSVVLKVAPGTQGGQTLRLRGKGLPRRDGPPGDLLVSVRIAVPSELSDRERQLFEELARESKFRPRA